MSSSASDTQRYLHTVWKGCRDDAFLEVSARINGPVGGVTGGEKRRVPWKTKHVRLGDMLDGGEAAVQPLLDLSGGEKRVDLYIGCMPLSAAPEKGRGKGAMREPVAGIWFDIDAKAPGREKSAQGIELFETAEDALTAFDAFCIERGVCAGVVTDSGWGIHAWILLKPDEINTLEPGTDFSDFVRAWNVDFSRWAREKYGVHVDIVSDKTRVLRIPGTMNWRRAELLDEAAAVTLVRCSDELRFGLDELGWAAIHARVLEQRRALAQDRAFERERGLDEDCALFDPRCALDACSWGEILRPFGWRKMAVEGEGEVERWGRPRGGSGGVAGEGEISSAVVYADAPWVLVVFSEASELPSWQEVRLGGEKPNTKWRTWVRLKYAGDEIAAAKAAVLVGLYGYPKGWPAGAVDVLSADAEILRNLDLWSSHGCVGVKAGVSV